MFKIGQSENEILKQKQLLIRTAVYQRRDGVAYTFKITKTMLPYVHICMSIGIYFPCTLEVARKNVDIFVYIFYSVWLVIQEGRKKTNKMLIKQQHYFTLHMVVLTVEPHL